MAKQIVGWRTRGQATYKPATLQNNKHLKNEDQTYVLAKAGIRPPRAMDKEYQNDYIVCLFLNRTPETTITTTRLRGIRDMWEEGIDLTDYEVEKIASMEFDWKRQPSKVFEVPVDFKGVDIKSHLTFETKPWKNIDQYHKTRELWSEYNNSTRHILKTIHDYNDFENFYNNKLIMSGSVGKYYRKKDGDQIKLRQQIAIAQSLRVVGTHQLKPHAFGDKKIFPSYHLRAETLSRFLSEVGMTCSHSKLDIENGRKKGKKVGWVPHQVPRNETTELILRRLKAELFPILKIDEFLTSKKPPHTLTSTIRD